LCGEVCVYKLCVMLEKSFECCSVRRGTEVVVVVVVAPVVVVT
jgi:hypothetical protein